MSRFRWRLFWTLALLNVLAVSAVLVISSRWPDGWSTAPPDRRDRPRSSRRIRAHSIRHGHGNANRRQHARSNPARPRIGRDNNRAVAQLDRQRGRRPDPNPDPLPAGSPRHPRTVALRGLRRPRPGLHRGRRGRRRTRPAHGPRLVAAPARSGRPPAAAGHLGPRPGTRPIHPCRRRKPLLARPALRPAHTLRAGSPLLQQTPAGR